MARIGGLLDPARHGVPRETLEPSDRGDGDALDSEGDNLVERSSPMLEAVIRRAQRLRKRLSTLNAAVSTAPPGPRSVETVADDASGTDLSMQRTLGIETTQLFHFAWALSTKELLLQESGSNSTTHAS